ncbi:N-acetyltransferase [Acetobacterium woodii]|uniref:Acetyltransferase GNAT family n=1 Tax=Acetobacterium woodii (strain ATCC 29683 / DSM 1030 / JCM 2381 / KCTC 1655 / WB1) TaxID=931626 RepID=H6LKU6_ACEWD|nr:N-acetyltransferase [Acetobacterium woodii]AFA50055.1 acetyltransferase GNAT family [Acetobacterium woodii DSM 1030]
MEFKQVTLENLSTEHICCAISDKKGENCVASKKAWMKERLKEGLVFNKLDVRGKVFIEYIPAEKAWYPIIAEGYMVIDCLWVSGQYKGQGYGDLLLEQCIADSQAKGKKGIVALSSQKKMPFLSDPKYLKHKGFQIADTAEPYFELLYLPFEKESDIPRIKENAKKGVISEPGLVLYYTNQCPHTDKYVPVFAETVKNYGLECKLYHINTKEAAQSAPAPFTTYALFYNGKFVTNEILSEKSFAKLWQKLNHPI